MSSSNNKRKLRISTSDYDPTKRWEKKNVRTDRLYGSKKKISASSASASSSASSSTTGGGGIRRFQKQKSSRDNTSSSKKRRVSSSTDRRGSTTTSRSSKTATKTNNNNDNGGAAATSEKFTTVAATITATHRAFVHRKEEAVGPNNSNINDDDDDDDDDNKDNDRRGSSIPNTIITRKKKGNSNTSSSNNDNDNSRRNETPFLHRETTDDTHYNDGNNNDNTATTNASSRPSSINTIQYNRGSRRVPMKKSVHSFSTTTTTTKTNKNDRNTTTATADYPSNKKRRKTNTVSSHDHHHHHPSSSSSSSSITASQKKNKISKADDDKDQDQDHHNNNNNNNNETPDSDNDVKQRYGNDREQQKQKQIVFDGDDDNNDDDNAADNAAEFTVGDDDNDNDDNDNGCRLVGAAVHFVITEKENRLILKEGITFLESVKRQPSKSSSSSSSQQQQQQQCQGKQQAIEAASASASATTTMNISTTLPGPSLVGRWSAVLVVTKKTKSYEIGDGTATNTIDRMHLRHDSVVYDESCPASRPLNYSDIDNNDNRDKKNNTNDLAQQQQQQRNIVVTVLRPQTKDRYKNVNGNNNGNDDDGNQVLTPPMAQRRIDETPGGSRQITDAVNRIASVGFFSSVSSSVAADAFSSSTVVLSPYKNSNRIDGGAGMMYFCNLPLNSNYYLLIARNDNLPGNPIVGIDVVFNDERTSDSLLKLKGIDFSVPDPSTKISDQNIGINIDNGHDYHASSEEEFTVDDEGKDDADDDEAGITTPSLPLTEAILKGQSHINIPRESTLNKKPSKDENIDTFDEAMASDSDEDKFGCVVENAVGGRGNTSIEIMGMSHVKDWRQRATSVDNRNGISSKKAEKMHDFSSSSSSSFSVDSNDDEEEEKGTPEEPMKLRDPTHPSTATFSDDDNDDEEEYRRRGVMEQKPKVLLSQFNAVASRTKKRNIVSKRNGNNNSNSNSNSRYNKRNRNMTPKGNKNVSTSQGKQKLNGKQDDKSRHLPKQTLKTDKTSQRKQKLYGKQEKTRRLPKQTFKTDSTSQMKQKLNRKQEKSRRVTIDWTEKERKSYVESRQSSIQDDDEDDDDSSCWDNDFDNLSIDSVVPFDDQYENNDDDNANFIFASSDEENEIPSVPNAKKRTTVEKSIEGVVQENKIEKSNLDSNALSSRDEINVPAEVEEGTNPTHLNVGHRLLRNAPRASRPYSRLGVSLVCAGLVLLFPLVRDPCRFRHLELRARKKSLPPPVLFQNHLQKANSAFSHGHGVTM